MIMYILKIMNIYMLSLEKENEKEEKIRVIGFYGNIPRCLKLYGIIRAGYTNYKVIVMLRSLRWRRNLKKISVNINLILYNL